MAASVERASSHPLAGAIVSAATARGLTPAAPRDVEQTIGKGVSGIVEGRHILVGTAGFLAERGIDTAVLAAAAEALRSGGASAVYVAIDDSVAGILGIAAARLGRRLSERPAGVTAQLEAVVMRDADTPDPIVVELRWPGAGERQQRP